MLSRSSWPRAISSSGRLSTTSFTRAERTRKNPMIACEPYKMTSTTTARTSCGSRDAAVDEMSVPTAMVIAKSKDDILAKLRSPAMRVRMMTLP